MKNTQKFITFGLIAVLIIGGIIVYRNIQKKAEAALLSKVTNEISVKVMKVTETDKTSGLVYKADIQPVNEAVITSKITGKVVKILFENGKEVHAGDSLIVLDTRDLDNQLKSAQNQLKILQLTQSKVEINFDSIRKSFDRTKQLYAADSISKVDYENAEAAYKVAEADKESTNASVEAVNISIENIQNLLADSIIKAPIKGYMDSKSVALGQFVAPGSVLGRVLDIDQLKAVVQVEQENINKISIGQKAKIMLMDNDTETFQGTVESIDIAANPVSRVFACRILVDNKEHKLHSGVYTKVEMISEEKTKVVTVPIDALLGNEGNYYLFVNENGIVSKRNVILGGIIKNTAEILSGIKVGEEVIYTNISMLQNGDKVTVVNE